MEELMEMWVDFNLLCLKFSLYNNYGINLPVVQCATDHDVLYSFDASYIILYSWTFLRDLIKISYAISVQHVLKTRLWIMCLHCIWFLRIESHSLINYTRGLNFEVFWGWRLILCILFLCWLKHFENNKNFILFVHNNSTITVF